MNINKPLTAVICFCLGFNLVFTLVPGNYFEAYEGIVSGLVVGLYTDPCWYDWYNDVGFFQFASYAWINTLFPGIQAYGIGLVVFSWISLLVVGSVFFRSLQLLNVKYIYPVFLLGYMLLAADQLLNLGTNRIVFFMAIGLFWWYELYRVSGKKIPVYAKFTGAFLLLWICLMRFEMVLLCSVFYLIILWYFNRLHFRALIPFFCSLTVFIAYFLLIIFYASEGKKTSFLKEKQFFDRNDLRTDQLPADLALDLQAFREFQFMDKEHFTRQFYDEVSKTGVQSSALQLIKGVGFHSFVSIFNKTWPKALGIWYLLAGCIALFIGLQWSKQGNRLKLFLCFAFFFLFPILLGVYVLIPSRFLVPYYALLFVVTSVLLLHYNLRMEKWVLILFAGMLLLKMKSTLPDYYEYRNTARLYTAEMEHLAKAVHAADSGDVVVAHMNPMKFFPASPWQAVEKQGVLFMNYYYFAVYQCYTDTWRRICQCDPLSLVSKTGYIIDNNCRLVISDASIEFFRGYMHRKYQMQLEVKKIGVFDDELNIYRLNYLKR